MGLGKLVAVAALGLIGYQQQALVQDQLGFIFEAMPTIQTYIEMSSMKSGLGAYYMGKGTTPPNLQSWLDYTYNTGKKSAGVDHWGVPYSIVMIDRLPAMRSCGPDMECDSADDIIMKIFARKKEGRE